MYIDRLGVQCVVVRHDMSRLYQGICGKFSLKYRGNQMSLGDPVGNAREREEEEKGSVVLSGCGPARCVSAVPRHLRRGEVFLESQG